MQRFLSRYVNPIPKSFNLQYRYINTVGVVGAGQMGIGIAHVAAAMGKKKVLLLDSNPAQVERGLKFIRIMINLCLY